MSQIVWSPLAQGVLTGKYLPGEQPPADTPRRARRAPAGRCSGFLTDDDPRPACSSCARSPTSSACRWPSSRVAWVLQNPNVAAAIIGASRPEQVHDNVKAAGVRLDDDVLKRIDDVLGDVVERDPGKTARG